MDFSTTNNRLTRWASSVLLICGLVSGNVNAAIEPGSLFLLATDESRNGSAEAYILDLNLDIITGDPSSFGGITDAGLAAWLGDSTAPNLISWGVFGAGILGTASQFKIASTVHPEDIEPQGLDALSLQEAIGNGNGVVDRANGTGATESFALAGTDFPLGFGDRWGVITDFRATAGLGELLPMYVFGVNNFFEPLEPQALEGFWNLDPTSGNLEFAPVPVPAAVWMFGAAIASLLGLRRRRTGY